MLRWPYVRPDNVVTKETWKRAKHLDPIAPVPIDRVIKRDLWDEGLERDSEGKFLFLFVIKMY